MSPTKTEQDAMRIAFDRAQAAKAIKAGNIVGGRSIAEDLITKNSLANAMSGAGIYEASSFDNITMTTSQGSNKVKSLLNLSTLFNSAIPFTSDGGEPVIDRAEAFYRFAKVTAITSDRICEGHLAIVTTAPGAIFTDTQSSTPYPMILDSAIDLQYVPQENGTLYLKPVQTVIDTATTVHVISMADIRLDLTEAIQKLVKRKAKSIYEGDTLINAFLYAHISHLDNGQQVYVSGLLRIAFHYVQKSLL